MQARHIKHPFPPICDEHSKIIILGSVPSVKSVEHNFFYMHPQNRFWKVLSALFDCDLYSASKDEKTAFLLAHNIALYDSVEECDIVGSSDNAISNVIPADIPAMIAKSKISHVFCNGKASYKYFASAYPSLTQITTLLPSTSPANATYNLDKLLQSWQEIKEYL